MSLPSSSIQNNSLKPTDLRDSSNLLNAEPEPIDDEEARRRREQLNRRPSYRMILKDLETVGDKQLKKEVDETNGDRQLQAPVPLSTYAAATNSNYITTMHSNLTNGNNRQPIRPLEVSAPSPMHAPPLIRPNPNVLTGRLVSEIPSQPPPQISPQSGLPRPPNNLILPVNTDILGMKPVSDAVALAASNAAAVSFMNNEWPANLLTAYNSTPSPASVGSNMGGSRSMPDHDDSSRKRQVRLLKNREAAKECRRKKKEYVKCLENRVAVLENQNKALIEELKTLKELYCRKEKAEMS